MRTRVVGMRLILSWCASRSLVAGFSMSPGITRIKLVQPQLSPTQTEKKRHQHRHIHHLAHLQHNYAPVQPIGADRPHQYITLKWVEECPRSRLQVVAAEAFLAISYSMSLSVDCQTGGAPGACMFGCLTPRPRPRPGLPQALHRGGATQLITLVSLLRASIYFFTKEVQTSTHGRM